jgi:hypothetical protein
VLKNWWWFFLPIILFRSFRFLYLWWIRVEVWAKKNKWILLEIKPPKEILKPFRAMEDVIDVLWGVYNAPNWREKWCEGEPPHAPFWFSFEIASFGGEIHFFIRILDVWRDMVEAMIYSQYPEAEISLVEDYTQKVPQDVPNKEWDLYAEDYSLMKDDVYPIRTYSMFFEERPEVVKEEKRLDPLDSLLEALAKLKPAEQLWFQIVANPITNADIPWVSRGEAVANKIAKRPEVAKPKSIFREIFEILVGGKEEAPPKEEGLIAPELALTPGEKDVLQGVETKISKKGFKTWMRIVYLYKRKEPHFLGNYKIIRSYLHHFSAQNLNIPVFWGPTRTRIQYWFRERRLYLRKRQQFLRYGLRVPSSWPRTMSGEPFRPFGFAPRGPGIRGTIILNSEELATIYHFPAKITAMAPAVKPVEAKKGGPPPGLPIK